VYDQEAWHWRQPFAARSADIQQEGNGIGCSIEARMHAFDIRWARSKGGCGILSRCCAPAADASWNPAANVYIFQQGNAPAHRARDTVELLRRETPSFIRPDLWPANSPDLNPVDYSTWGCVQQRVYRSQWTMLTNWSNVWLRSGLA